MWKNFFYFSGSQRAGIVLLLTLIMLISVLNHFLPLIMPQDPVLTDSAFVYEFNKFRESLTMQDSLDEARMKSKYTPYEFRKQGYPEDKRQLFAFDPNNLDSVGFVRLGLKPWLASNILKFRVKGGKFKSPEDFARIYGLKPEQFNELSGYIRIEKQNAIVSEEQKTLENIKRPERIELNTADTAKLMQIKGVGAYFAGAIVRFRNRVGGYYAVEQLHEIQGMTPELYAGLKEICFVDTLHVRKIKVNTASVDKLNAHPYLNFYQAKQIYELRRKKGKLSSVSELEKLSELDKVTLEKIRSYFNFE